MNRTNENQQLVISIVAMWRSVGPSVMIRSHVTPVWTLSCSTGGHVDQEVGPQNKLAVGKYQ